MGKGNVADVVKECVVVEKGNVDDVNDDESAEGIEIVIVVDVEDVEVASNVGWIVNDVDVGERRVEAVDL